jgi:polyhydroxyalkanoate synthesis repressor PhaR
MDKRIIKKYSNRRLYDTARSCYITLDDVRSLVCEGIDFRVENAKTGEDLTRSILLQIILEQEVMQVPMFTESSLRNIIMFYGSTLQGSLGVFLDQSMPMLLRMQREMSRRGDLGPMDGQLWSELATMQGRMLSTVFQGFMERGMNVYSNAQRQFSQGAEQMFKLSDFAFPFASVEPKDPVDDDPEPSGSGGGRKKGSR